MSSCSVLSHPVSPGPLWQVVSLVHAKFGGLAKWCLHCEGMHSSLILVDNVAPGGNLVSVNVSACEFSIH